MANAEEYTNRDGWTTGKYHNRQYFPQLLWKILQEKGFENPPSYYCKEENSCIKFSCVMYVHIPESESHPNWKLDEVRVEGSRFDDTLQTTAMTTLTELCEKNKIEMGDTSGTSPS